MKQIQKQEFKDAFLRWSDGAKLRKWKVTPQTSGVSKNTTTYLVEHENGSSALYNVKTGEVETFKVKIETIDLEPTWEAIVTRMIYPENLDELRPELVKLAKTGDLIRGAQKRNESITFFPDGRYEKR